MSPALVLLFALALIAVLFLARFAGRPIPALPALIFALLALAFVSPGLFSRRTILPVDHAMSLPPWSYAPTVTRHNDNLSDVATQIVPWAQAVRLAWREGSIPWRNRWNGCGMALAANGQSAPFSPFTLLLLPLPLWAGFNLLATIKLLLAASGTYLWLSELSVSRGAALFGAVSFSLSFAITPWLLFPISSVLCLFPWALFAIERLLSAPTPARAFLLLTGVLFAMALSGHPESIVMGGLFAASWLAGRAAFTPGGLSGGRVLVLRILLAGAAAAGLAAFLLVPEALAIAGSNRLRYVEAARAHLPPLLAAHGFRFPSVLWTTLFPRTFGDAVDAPMVAGAAGAFPEIGLGFFGVVGAAAAALFLRPGPRPAAEKALVPPILVGLAIASGLWPFFDAAYRVPGLRLTAPFRYLILMALGGPALAAFEIDRLLADARRRPRLALWLAAAALALGALGLAAGRLTLGLHAASGGLASERRGLLLALAALGAVALAGLAASIRPRLLAAVPLVLAIFAAADLAIEGTRLYRFGRPEELFPETPVVRFLRSRPGVFRVVGEGPALFPGSNVFAGVEDIRVHDPVERADYVDFVDHEAGYEPAEYFKRLRNLDAAALDLLNVRFLVAAPGRAVPGARWERVYEGGDASVFKNRSVLPRVFGARRAAPAEREAADGFVLTDYRERANRLDFRVDVPPGPPVSLVASVTDDGGWSAFEDGRTIPVRRTEGVLLGWDLPPGRHDVRLTYRPPGLAAGGAISAGSAVLLLVSWTGAIVRRRRAKRAADKRM